MTILETNMSVGGKYDKRPKSNSLMSSDQLLLLEQGIYHARHGRPHWSLPVGAAVPACKAHVRLGHRGAEPDLVLSGPGECGRTISTTYLPRYLLSR